MPHLEIKVEEPVGAVVRLAAIGELDAASAAQLEAALDAQLVDGRRVSLDLSEISFIDSSALRVLLAAQKAGTEAGSGLVVSAASEPVKRLLQMTGLNHVLLAG